MGLEHHAIVYFFSSSPFTRLCPVLSLGPRSVEKSNKQTWLFTSASGMVKCFINLALPCLRLLRQLYLLYLYLSPWFYLSDSVPNKTESHPHTTHTYKNTHLCTPFLVSCILLYYNFMGVVYTFNTFTKKLQREKKQRFCKEWECQCNVFLPWEYWFCLLDLNKERQSELDIFWYSKRPFVHSHFLLKHSTVSYTENQHKVY